MKRFRFVWIIVLAVVVVATWLLGSRILQKRGYDGMGDFLGQTVVNYPKSFDADPLKLRIEVSEDNYARLQDVVDKARARGVIMPDGNDYVKAVIESEGHEFKGKVRIKGKLTDHVKGKKWSFRVILRGSGSFIGMRRFSLQHPGTRNYLYEWFYHRMMEREGVINLRYGLVDVALNQKELGLYAYEEHFGQELLERNKRPPGPIFRFDPGLYWIRRLHEMDGLRFREAYADHHAALIDSYDSGDVFKDEGRTEDFRKALVKMNALRSGLIPASAVFDVERIALRHAVIDLIGGHHSMDWSDVKFYYNPLADIIEPVAYESFSVRPLKQLAGSFKFTNRSKSRKEIHDIIFNDERIFRSYVHSLERVSSAAYLDSLFDELDAEIDSISAIMFSEFPYKPLNKELYYQNAAVIRETLDFPKGVHTFISRSNDGKLDFQFVPISDLPVEVHAVQLHGVNVTKGDVTVLPARIQGRLGQEFVLHSELSDTLLSDYESISVEWSVLGGSSRKFSKVIPVEFPSTLALGREVLDENGEGLKRFLMMASIDGTDVMLDSPVMLEMSAHVPDSLSTIFRSGARLELMPNVQLRLSGPVDWSGTMEKPIEIIMHEGSEVVLDGWSKKALTYTSFKQVHGHTASMVRGHGTRINLSNVSFMGNDSTDLLECGQSKVLLENCSFYRGNDMISSYFSDMTMSNCTVSNANDDGILMHGGDLRMNNTMISNSHDDALRLNASAIADLKEVSVESSSTALDVKNGSYLKGSEITIENCAIGVKTDKSFGILEPSKVELVELQMNQVEEEVVKGQGSVVELSRKESRKSGSEER